jgi:uncharacterized membrane protein YhaH (DUF805 family)
MNGKIDLTDLLFSADGRVDRLPFIVTSVVLVGLLTIYESLVHQNEALRWITGVFAYGFLFFTGVCILSKRLHDRGRSGWWSLVVVFAFVLAWPFPEHFWGWLALIFLIWAVVELVLMPGEQGANRFGPNPHRAVGPT